MLTRFLFLFSSLIFTQYHPQEWGSITSLLTPTGIKSTTDGIVYASTSGGLLEFNPDTEKFTSIKMEDGLVYLDLSCIEIDNKGRLWLGGAYPNGYLQVYDPDRGLVCKITHLDIAEIKMIRIGENIAFAVYEGATSSDIGILEFKFDEDGIPDYQDFYTNFTDETITEIRDLDIFYDSLYVTTDKGIFVGNYNNNLKSADNWTQQFYGDTARQFVHANYPFVITESSILQKEGDNWADYYVGLIGKVIHAELKGEVIKVLTDKWYYEFDQAEIQYKFNIPFSDNTYKTDFNVFCIQDDNILFFGLENYGILKLYTPNDKYDLYVPDTPFNNNFQAISILLNGNLAAASQEGIVISTGNQYMNYFPWEKAKYFPVPLYTNTIEGNNFISKSLQYVPGEHFPITIVEKNNGNIMFGNSGIVPNPNYPNGYKRGGLVEFNYQKILTEPNYDFFVYDTTNALDGWWGIYSEDGADTTASMYVNQLIKDKDGNIWVTNPFCEKNRNLLAIQMADDGTWLHVHIPDNLSFRPQTIALDKMNRAWIGFAYDSDYSSGGIKVFSYSDVLSDLWTDSSWISIDNPEKLPGNDPYASVWSLVFDQMDFIWILNEKGVRGFTYTVNDNAINLDPILKAIDGTAIDFLSYISYTKGNRIRVDSQNNKWVITHQGVWVIQESMAYWPSEKGLNTENSGLLSDIVYDVAFDNDKGLAYLATDKGISILQIPFADHPEKKQSMYISPNPFVMPDDERVIIKNVPSGSIIKIMTITGTLIKEIQLPSNESQADWDGTNEKGEQVGTAVYLVAAHHSTERNKVSKIAVIRK